MGQTLSREFKMATKTKILSQPNYLKAVGLFSLTNNYYQRAFEAEELLFELLGVDPHGGLIGDAVVSRERNALKAFQEALKGENINISKARKAIKRG